MEAVQPHIRLSSEIGVEFALLPGDPKRVSSVLAFLESPQEVEFNREYRSAIGYYKGVKVLVMSTGMGGPSVGIGVEELKNIGVKTMIRIGSCGALQPHMKLGDLVIASGAVRNEGTSNTYIEQGYPAVSDTSVLFQLKKTAEEFQLGHHIGIIRSHDSFYTDEESKIDAFWQAKKVLASDMETAPLLVIASLRGLKAASILNVVVTSDGDLEDGINEYVDGESATMKGEQNEILLALETIVKLHTESSEK